MFFWYFHFHFTFLFIFMLSHEFSFLMKMNFHMKIHFQMNFPTNSWFFRKNFHPFPFEAWKSLKMKIRRKMKRKKKMKIHQFSGIFIPFISCENSFIFRVFIFLSFLRNFQWKCQKNIKHLFALYCICRLKAQEKPANRCRQYASWVLIFQIIH